MYEARTSGIISTCCTTHRTVKVVIDYNMFALIERWSSYGTDCQIATA